MDIGSYFVDVKALPEDAAGFVQLIFLGTTYGYILCYASNLISDGSELLLLIPSMAGLIGSVVLPVLGAVPDGCMVLFSGLGPEAQGNNSSIASVTICTHSHQFNFFVSEQLNVGIGTLAGSTIMLLTMPWFLSILGGRVNLDPTTRQPLYKNIPKLDPPGNFDLFNCGISLSKMVHMEAYVMMLTSLTYLVIQVPGMLYINESKSEQAAGEKIFAQIGAFMCLFFFIGYLYLQYHHSGNADSLQDQTRDRYLRDAIAQKKVTLLGVMLTEYKAELLVRKEKSGKLSPYHRLGSNEENASFSPKPEQHDFSARFLKRLRKILRPFFNAYDADGNNSLQLDELRVLFEDLGESLTKQEVLDVFSKFDINHDGSIDYDEFVRGVCDYILLKQTTPKAWNYEDVYQPAAARRRLSRASTHSSNHVRHSSPFPVL